MGNIDFYDLVYRNYKNHELNNLDLIDINYISSEIKHIVNEHLKYMKNINNKDFNEIKFSDVELAEFPVFDGNKIIFTYLPVFSNGIKDISPSENVDRFRKFDINKLPLIEVAKLLGIKIEKSNYINPYGKYIVNENKIILGSDYAPTFIHELVHAIVHYLGKANKLFYVYDHNYNEFIAEYSALILCKTYNISINTSYSLYYIKMHKEDIEYGIPDHIINRVEIICEFVKKCEEIIKKQK